MTRKLLLIIDSRDRLPGGSVNDFRVDLRNALSNVQSVRLLYANIASPSGDVQPYYLIRTSLGSHVRPAVEGDSATFVVPRSAASGFRTFHAENTTFPAIVFETPGRSLSSLEVSVRAHGGASAGLTGDWFCVVEVCCD